MLVLYIGTRICFDKHIETIIMSYIRGSNTLAVRRLAAYAMNIFLGVFKNKYSCNHSVSEEHVSTHVLWGNNLADFIAMWV